MKITAEVTITHDYLPREKKGLIYRKVIGKSKTWVYPTNALSPASDVHCSASPRENVLGYRGFRGYGGATLIFHLEDGTEERMTGPWNSSAEALFADTGVDIRDQYLTYVIIAKERALGERYTTIFKGIVYQDKNPVLGKFLRGDIIAMKLAKKMKRKLYLYSESMGGSSERPVTPDQELKYEAGKVFTGLSPEQSDIVKS